MLPNNNYLFMIDYYNRKFNVTDYKTHNIYIKVKYFFMMNIHF